MRQSQSFRALTRLYCPMLPATTDVTTAPDPVEPQGSVSCTRCWCIVELEPCGGAAAAKALGTTGKLNAPSTNRLTRRDSADNPACTTIAII